MGMVVGFGEDETDALLEERERGGSGSGRTGTDGHGHGHFMTLTYTCIDKCRGGFLRVSLVGESEGPCIRGVYLEARFGRLC